jgi:hypothetical protein
MNVEQKGPSSTCGNDKKNQLKRSHDTDSDSFSLTEEDSPSQRDANEARIRIEFKARESMTKSV